jgi:hypothetical protein
LYFLLIAYRFGKTNKHPAKTDVSGRVAVVSHSNGEAGAKIDISA